MTGSNSIRIQLYPCTYYVIYLIGTSGNVHTYSKAQNEIYWKMKLQWSLIITIHQNASFSTGIFKTSLTIQFNPVRFITARMFNSWHYETYDYITRCLLSNAKKSTLQEPSFVKTKATTNMRLLDVKYFSRHSLSPAAPLVRTFFTEYTETFCTRVIPTTRVRSTV